MKVGITLLLLAVSVAAVSAGYPSRSGYDCRKYCGYDYVPVCSTDSTTYDNECMLKCNWSYKDCDGECPCYRPPPPIFYEPRPVYFYESSAPSDCNCGPDKDYVCSTDGETYDNECEARCDKKFVQCDGACPCT